MLNQNVKLEKKNNQFAKLNEKSTFVNQFPKQSGFKESILATLNTPA